VLLCGEAPEQREQLGALVVVESNGDGVFVLAGHPAQFGEHLSALVGEGDRVVAAVSGVAVAGDESSPFELVDQGDESWRVHSQRVGQLALALSW
jgi:hypothetical protein